MEDAIQTPMKSEGGTEERTEGTEGPEETEESRFRNAKEVFRAAKRPSAEDEIGGLTLALTPAHRQLP